MHCLRENASQLTLALVGVLVAVAVSSAFTQGANAERLERIAQDLDQARSERMGLGEGPARLSDDIVKGAVEARLDDLQQNTDAQALDIPGILVSQDLVRKGDIFTAAVIDGDLWVIPDDTTLARYVERGAEVESISNLVSGIRVTPIGLQ